MIRSKIGYAGVDALNVIADIEHNTGKEVKYERKTHSQKRGVDKKQADFRNRDIEAPAQIGTNAKGIFFEEC